MVGGVIILATVVTALVMSVVTASADIEPPDWTATPLPSSADQPGAVSVTGAGCGPSGGVAMSDRFVSDGEPTKTETGQTWISDSSGTWQISNGSLSYTASDANLGYLVADAGAPDGRMSFSVDRLTETFWAVFRYRDPLNHYRFGRENNGAYKFEKVESGVVQGFAPFSADIQPRSRDRIDITFEADDSINVYRDDDWLYGDGLTFNIREPMIGFATGSTSTDTRTSEIGISSVSFAPYSGVPVTASVMVSAQTSGITVATETMDPDNNGSWTGRLEIPSDNGTGNYKLTAICTTPGYELVYNDLNVHVSFDEDANVITDFSASLDLDRVEKSRTFDPVTLAALSVVLLAAFAFVVAGAIHRHRGHGDKTA